MCGGARVMAAVTVRKSRTWRRAHEGTDARRRLQKGPVAPTHLLEELNMTHSDQIKWNGRTVFRWQAQTAACCKGFQQFALVDQIQLASRSLIGIKRAILITPLTRSSRNIVDTPSRKPAAHPAAAFSCAFESIGPRFLMDQIIARLESKASLQCCY